MSYPWSPVSFQGHPWSLMSSSWSPMLFPGNLHGPWCHPYGPQCCHQVIPVVSNIICTPSQETGDDIVDDTYCLWVICTSSPYVIPTLSLSSPCHPQRLGMILWTTYFHTLGMTLGTCVTPKMSLGLKSV